MVEFSRPPLRDERDEREEREKREFWDARLADPARPRRGTSARPRGEARRARAADSALTRLGDRLHDWRADTRVGVVVLVLVAVVAGVVWYRLGIGGAGAGEPDGPPAAVTTTAPTTTLTGPAPSSAGGGGAKGAGTIAVHVAGAVNHPGVVELRTGSRVIDAVEAVGGARADGDLDRLNLAATVTDGQRVYVAKVGQADPGVTGDAGGGSGGTDAGGAGRSGAGGARGAGAKVNLNTATQAQLEELPGIGPTYAQAIIAERQRRGGFKSVNDLRSVRGIGDKRFSELAPLVAV